MGEYQVTGINLRGMPLGEQDRLLTVLTRERGLLQLVATGARKHRSPIAGLSGLFVVNDLIVASGLSWDEKYYSPFSIVTRAYFDDNLKDMILGLDIKEKPGQSFKYLSGATQLLAMCIEKATGEHLSDYVSKHL